MQERSIIEAVVSKVDSVVAGDLSRRIDPNGKDGVFKHLAEHLNLLIDRIDAIVSDRSASIGAIAQGGLTSRMSQEHQGTFATLRPMSTAWQTGWR